MLVIFGSRLTCDQLVAGIVAEKVGLAVGVDLLPEIADGVIDISCDVAQGVGLGHEPIHAVVAEPYPRAREFLTFKGRHLFSSFAFFLLPYSRRSP
jgi:hypothetical protein